MELYSWNVCERMIESPHCLIAGTTGSGKSVLLNSTIFTALARPSGFIFIDLKRVELSRYRKMVKTLRMVTEPKDVVPALDYAIQIMEKRYKRARGKTTTEPDLYIVIDELADLVNDKQARERIVKIGRLGRAAKVHLICATQDPSRRTLCAQLMQNFTCCVALRCRSAIESRQIIGVSGAEELPRYGKGILWDADGTDYITVPMTPEEDLDTIVEALRRTLFWRQRFDRIVKG